MNFVDYKKRGTNETNEKNVFLTNLQTFTSLFFTCLRRKENIDRGFCLTPRVIANSARSNFPYSRARSASAYARREWYRRKWRRASSGRAASPRKFSLSSIASFKTCTRIGESRRAGMSLAAKVTESGCAL